MSVQKAVRAHGSVSGPDFSGGPRVAASVSSSHGRKPGASTMGKPHRTHNMFALEQRALAWMPQPKRAPQSTPFLGRDRFGSYVGKRSFAVDLRAALLVVGLNEDAAIVGVVDTIVEAFPNLKFRDNSGRRYIYSEDNSKQIDLLIKQLEALNRSIGGDGLLPAHQMVSDLRELKRLDAVKRASGGDSDYTEDSD